MKDSPIIILDEATANVDPENEAELTKAIEELTIIGAGSVLHFVYTRLAESVSGIRSTV